MYWNDMLPNTFEAFGLMEIFSECTENLEFPKSANSVANAYFVR